ncbi:inorganic phosphate transporter [Patulibacter sp. SYSU D01012]|uniref:inorganic phosphate transporter n=1 Tax=Patulibacter sp. SYSU D01012 TaxID=2817381 RepID=UPI001B31674D|nr:inorganic phosphate transporter [Patulibacter sp. SYSU D01012]
MGSDVLLAVVIAAAVSFDFTNGFHDTANAMATSIATRALSPRAAVLLSAALNFVGAFVSVKVATTIAEGIVDNTVIAGDAGLALLFAALAGAMLWNLVTWALSLPSSSSHALIGGIVGAVLIAHGTGAIKGEGLIEKVLLPAVLAPLLCGFVAALGTFVAYRLRPGGPTAESRRAYRYGQLASASLVSLAHGTNDAQKTMGVITLALVAHGTLDDASAIPLWVKVVAALAIAGGTAIGGWRIIRTLGKRLTEIEAPQGFVAESSSTSVILASSYFGYPLSTTHVVSGGILGVGIGKRLSEVRWGLFGTMVVAWVFTIPAAGLVAAAIWEGSEAIGSGSTGSVIMAILSGAAALTLFVTVQRKAAVEAHDTVGDHDDEPAPPARAAAPTPKAA